MVADISVTKIVVSEDYHGLEKNHWRPTLVWKRGKCLSSLTGRRPLRQTPAQNIASVEMFNLRINLYLNAVAELNLNFLSEFSNWEQKENNIFPTTLERQNKLIRSFHWQKVKLPRNDCWSGSLGWNKTSWQNHRLRASFNFRQYASVTVTDGTIGWVVIGVG